MVSASSSTSTRLSLIRRRPAGSRWFKGDLTEAFAVGLGRLSPVGSGQTGTGTDDILWLPAQRLDRRRAEVNCLAGRSVGLQVGVGAMSGAVSGETECNVVPFRIP